MFHVAKEAFFVGYTLFLQSMGGLLLSTALNSLFLAAVAVSAFAMI
jgi:hypothetical protein